MLRCAHRWPFPRASAVCMLSSRKQELRRAEGSEHLCTSFLLTGMELPHPVCSSLLTECKSRFVPTMAQTKEKRDEIHYPKRCVSSAAARTRGSAVMKFSRILMNCLILKVSIFRGDASKVSEKKKIKQIPLFLERRRGVSKKTKKNREEKKTQKEKRKKKIKERPFGHP